MHKNPDDTENLHETWSFCHKDMDLLQDTAKSAKNNTSDWKADWKNRVFWHCLIKLCCFSHQDCQQKAKHIVRMQFSPQADTKWHTPSLLPLSASCIPTLPIDLPSRKSACSEPLNPAVAFPQLTGGLGSTATQPIGSNGAWQPQGQGTTCTKQESSPLARALWST